MAKHVLAPTNTYTFTSKVYKPRAAHNLRSYQALQKVAKNGSFTGAQASQALTLTQAAIGKLVKETGWRAAPVNPNTGKASVSGYRENHASFVGYLVKGGYLTCKVAKA